MADEKEKNGVNIEVSEDNTTEAPNDVFENAELKFPCEFPLSVMGLNVPEYKDVIFGIIKKHVPEVTESMIEVVYSSNKKYCSVKTRFTAQSREQMDALYKELTANELTKWVL